MDQTEILRLAEQEHYAPAMHVLGALYAGTQDLPVDIGSWSFALQDCSNNNGDKTTTTCHNPLPKDLEKSHHYYSRAADLGYAPSKYMLAKHYLDGTFHHSHRRRVAMGFLRSAANDGYVLAALHLALLQHDHTLVDYKVGGEEAEEAIRVLRRVVNKFPADVAQSAKAYLEDMGVDIDGDNGSNHHETSDAMAQA
jgi:TPR repeat protein